MFGSEEDAKLTRSHMATRQEFSSPALSMFFLSSVFLLALSAQASILTLKSPRFTVADSTGSQIRSESISLEHKLSAPVDLSQTDIVKITFQIIDDTDKGVQPHQTFLRFYDEKSGEEGIQPIRVTPGGKAKFELVCYTNSLIVPVYLRIPLGFIQPSSLVTSYTSKRPTSGDSPHWFCSL